MKIFILAALFATLASPATAGGCLMSYCKGNAATLPAPGERLAITNDHRQRIGDVYNPGLRRRIQIRDTSRRIIGYIEADGSITNTSRQRVGKIEDITD